MNSENELKFEKILWLVFIGLGILNIYGDNKEIRYLKTKNAKYKEEANKIFETTIIVTMFIYLYFLKRNINAYQNVSQERKSLYQVKVLGSIFLVSGILCLLYFQEKEETFIGSPSI